MKQKLFESRRAFLQTAGLASAGSTLGLLTPWYGAANAQTTDLDDPSVVGKYTASTRVILSFGAAYGGFEFAMQLRSDIMEKAGKPWNNDPATVYLDHQSLKNAPGTKYEWDVEHGIHKMSNAWWKDFYKGAMDNAMAMVFIVTGEWLKSKWCWLEFEWYLEQLKKRERPNLLSVFLVFDDANPSLALPNFLGGENQNSNLSPILIWEGIRKIKDVCLIPIATPVKKIATNELIVRDDEEISYVRERQYRYSTQEKNAVLDCLANEGVLPVA